MPVKLNDRKARFTTSLPCELLRTIKYIAFYESKPMNTVFQELIEEPASAKMAEIIRKEKKDDML